MKLWVDDVRKPTKDWIWAKTAEEAIRILATQHIDEVSLDHDAGANERVDAATFQPVAYYLVAKYKEAVNSHPAQGMFIPKIYIHSANPVGAQTLKNILGMGGITARISPVVS